MIIVNGEKIVAHVHNSIEISSHILAVNMILFSCNHETAFPLAIDKCLNCVHGGNIRIFLCAFSIRYQEH